MGTERVEKGLGLCVDVGWAPMCSDLLLPLSPLFVRAGRCAVQRIPISSLH